MTKHLVSIIIPVYNVSDYVEECLQSVAAQTYTDIECIIVDDCGTDDSMQKVEQFVTSYQGPIAFKILHHEHNRGLSAARNTGMDAATGDFISFIDSDDYIQPQMYKVLVNAFLEEDNVAIIGCNCWRDPGIDITNDPRYNVSTKTIIDSKNFAEMFLLGRIMGSAWGKLYRKQLFEFVRFREGRIGEDFLLMYDLYPFIENSQYNTIIIPDKLYYYRYRENSIITSTIQPYKTEQIRNWGEILKGLKKAKHPIADKFQKRFIPLLYYYIIELSKRNKSNQKDYYHYCFMLWGLSDYSVKKSLPDKTDFKPYLLMKYLPHIYYYYSQRIQRKSTKE